MARRPSVRLPLGSSVWLFVAACATAGKTGVPGSGAERGVEAEGGAGDAAAALAGTSSEGGDAEEAGSGPAGTAGATGSVGSGGRGASAGAKGGNTGGAKAGGTGGASVGVGGAGDDPGSAGEMDAGGARVGGGGSAGESGVGDVFEVVVGLASDVKASAPGTVGIVTFTADAPGLVDAHVEFGLDTTYGMTAPVELDAPLHRALLLGMKPSRLYHLSIVASDGTRTYRSADRTLLTGPATTLVPHLTFNVLDESRRERGFLLLSYRDIPGRNVPFIVDADGDVVWWYESDMPGVAHLVLSATGKNLWLVGTGTVGSPVRRLSLDTLEEQIYPDTVASHDMTSVTGETMAYLDYGETDCDSVFEIEPSGETREVFESEGLVDPNVCHGNAIRYSVKQDTYTYSDRYQDVFVLSREGELLWRLSERVPGGNAAWGGAQHGHELLDDSLLIFANAGVSTTVSAAIEFDFAGNELRRFDTGHFSLHMGDVQRLPQGNTLVTFSNESFIQELDADGNVVLELQGEGNHFGYSTWRQSLYGAP